MIEKGPFGAFGKKLFYVLSGFNDLQQTFLYITVGICVGAGIVFQIQFFFADRDVFHDMLFHRYL